MQVLRTSMAGLLVAALCGASFAASPLLSGGTQKDGKGSCHDGKGCSHSHGLLGLASHKGGKGACGVECGTKTVTVRIYGCKCTTVCLLGPPRCSGLRGLMCGGGKGCGGKGDCGKADKGDGKGACQNGACQGGCGKGDCGKGYGCDTSRCVRTRVKKHLLVKDVEIECPITVCESTDKGRCAPCGSGKSGKPFGGKAKGGKLQDSKEVAPRDVPDEPPPVRISQVVTGVIRASHVSSDSDTDTLGSLFK
jgi:hypothetical protein